MTWSPMIPFWAWTYGRTHDLLDILLRSWAKQDPILPRHKKVPTQHLLLKLLKQNKRHSDQMNMLSIPIENFKTLATKLPPISINVSKKKSTNQLIPSVTWLNWTGWLRCQNSPLHGELPIKPPKDMHYKPLAISVSVLAKMKREFRDKPTMTV